MKKRSTRPYRGAVRHDVRQDFKLDQLQEIGAVCMAFNMLEGALDFILAANLNLDFQAATIVGSKLSGISAKIDALRAIARDDLHLAEDIWKETLDKVNECKGYRDTLIHTRIVDAAVAIGETTQKGNIDHVLLSKHALSGLYDLIVAVHNEFASLHYVMKLQSELRDETSSRSDVPPRALIEEHLQDAHQRLQQDRQSRQALKPLPPVPNLFPPPE